MFVSAIEQDPAQADVVRVVSEARPARSSGPDCIPSALKRVCRTASRVARMQPDDADLAAAVEIIRLRILGELPRRPERHRARNLRAISDRRVITVDARGPGHQA